MIRAGKQYRRRLRPHTVVTVVSRSHGKVTYQLKRTTMTISVAAFKEIYERNSRWLRQK
jgi:hypothetical protein